MYKYITPLLLTVALAGCATLEPVVPEGYAGPTAKISDFGLQEDAGKGQLFYVAAVDGKTINNSRTATERASYGQGSRLSMGYVDREIPVKPLRIKLVATHVTAAPIQEIASRVAGTFYRVEGEVTFTPEAGHQYFVKGNLQKGDSSVWIADAQAESVPVSEVVHSAKN